MTVSDAATFVLSFGRHRDKPLSAMPRGYLMWLLANATNLHADTRQMIEAFLKQPAPRPKTAQGELPGTKPRRARRAPRERTDAEPATCTRCGLPGSAARPLVHADCVSDEVPF